MLSLNKTFMQIQTTSIEGPWNLYEISAVPKAKTKTTFSSVFSDSFPNWYRCFYKNVYMLAYQ